MPIYEYGCDSCHSVFDVEHSMTEKPEVRCLVCSGICRKMITPFYLGNSGCMPCEAEMRQDLRENHGMEHVRLQSGTFNDFYCGVKRDARRVKEELTMNRENRRPSDLPRISEKEAAARYETIRRKKAEDAFKRRSVTI